MRLVPNTYRVKLESHIHENKRAQQAVYDPPSQTSTCSSLASWNSLLYLRKHGMRSN